MENKADYDIKYNNDNNDNDDYRWWIYYKWRDALFNIFQIRICTTAVDGYQ